MNEKTVEYTTLAQSKEMLCDRDRNVSEHCAALKICKSLTDMT